MSGRKWVGNSGVMGGCGEAGGWVAEWSRV